MFYLSARLGAVPVAQYSVAGVSASLPGLLSLHLGGLETGIDIHEAGWKSMAASI